jgi:hypothetical protein
MSGIFPNFDFLRLFFLGIRENTSLEKITKVCSSRTELTGLLLILIVGKNESNGGQEHRNTITSKTASKFKLIRVRDEQSEKYRRRLKLTWRPFQAVSSWGQMSELPEKGETVIVRPSRTGRLSLYPPSG